MSAFTSLHRRIRQPKGRAEFEASSPLGAVLDRLWLGNDIAGRDLVRGQLAPPASGIILRAKQEGVAVYNPSGIANPTVTFTPTIAAFPYFQFGYGVFDGPSGSGDLIRMYNSGGGYESTLSSGTNTTVQFDIRFNFGTQQTLTVTLPTALNTPICAIAQVFSSTDYRLYVNGKQVNGTTSPGTLGSIDAFEAIGSRGSASNSLAMGFGQGRTLPDWLALAITANPQLYVWQAIKARAFSIGLDAAGPAGPVVGGGWTFDDIAFGGGYVTAPTTLAGNFTFDDIAFGGGFANSATLTGDFTLADIAYGGGFAQYQGTIVTPPIRNNTGQLQANLTGVVVNVYNQATGALIVRLTGQTTDALGQCTFKDQSMLLSVQCSYEVDLTGSSGGNLGRRLPVATPT